MIIFMLAAAMTLAMLIATAFGIHQESQKMRLEAQRANVKRNRLR